MKKDRFKTGGKERDFGAAWTGSGREERERGSTSDVRAPSICCHPNFTVIEPLGGAAAPVGDR